MPAATIPTQRRRLQLQQGIARFLAQQRVTFECCGCHETVTRAGWNAYATQRKLKAGKPVYCDRGCYARNVRWRKP